MKKINTFFICLLSVMFISCGNSTDVKKIKGTGIIATSQWMLNDFTRLGVAVNSEVFYYENVLADRSISVETDEELLPYINISNTDGMLEVTLKEELSINNNIKVKINVISHDLRQLSILGDVSVKTIGEIYSDRFYVNQNSTKDVDISFLSCDELAGKLKNSGNLLLSGNAKKGSIINQGKGNVVAEELLVNDCSVSIENTGSVFCFVKDSLTVNILGKGDVGYKGNPVITKSNIEGRGNLLKSDLEK